eukprot:c4665_g1_i1.p1 GENE.c4665_g1_i1~~c4665_g1_i1.p1  ORF type:complete len:530 (+),score=118.97 c4665_g1_i1:15-1604(+)
MIKSVLRAGVVGVAGVGTYVTYSDSTDGIRRSVKLWTEVAPVVAHYRVVEFKHKILTLSEDEKDEDWQSLHNRYADKILDTLRGLQGFYIKVGQVLASRPDTLPKQYCEKMRSLEDDCPAHSADYVKKTIRESLQCNINELFSEFDEVPLGSASIGQVHRARLRASGKEVAIKVQYPDIEPLFRSDIQTARNFCKILVPEQVLIFDEIEKQFLTEFDYRAEAVHLDKIRKNLLKFTTEVVVPEPYLELCTRQVLVMEYLKGEKLVDGVRRVGSRLAKRQGKTLDQLEAEIRAKWEKEGLPAPYKGPGVLLTELYRNFLAVKTVLSTIATFSWNVVATITQQPKWEYEDYRLPLNPAKVMDVLMRVHGHELLIDGQFNGDPHAGNFLILKDGRIGLIDYGQVKSLSTEQRHQLCRIYAALNRQDKEKLMQLSRELNYKSRSYDKDVLMNMITFSLDRDGKDVTGGLNVQQFLDEMYRRDPWESVSELVIMPTRMSFLLRGIGLLVNHPVSCVRYWGPLAEKVLRDENVEY